VQGQIGAPGPSGPQGPPGPLVSYYNSRQSSCVVISDAKVSDFVLILGFLSMKIAKLAYAKEAYSGHTFARIFFKSLRISCHKLI
jgi:hypothetical protein